MQVRGNLEASGNRRLGSGFVETKIRLWSGERWLSNEWNCLRWSKYWSVVITFYYILGSRASTVSTAA